VAPTSTRSRLFALGAALATVVSTATARAQETAELQSAPPDPPKVAVVTVGDPDELLREQAERVDQILLAGEGLRLPEDGALRRALRGEPASEEGDGLDRTRAVRRGLGMDEATDAPILARLGRMSGAVAVVVVRRREGAPEAVVLDVSRAAFFAGEIALADSGDTEILRFVRTRARAAATRATGTDAIATPRSGDARDARADRTTRHRPAEPVPEDDGESEPSWLETNWPLLVAGALLVGMIVYLALPQDPAAPPSPVLRFIPGGDR